MDIYVYQAALLCEDCGVSKRAEILESLGIKATTRSRLVLISIDSELFPDGPQAEGGGEADSPQHCDTCGVFLENPLTSAGATYVEAAVAEAVRSGRGLDSVEATVWAPFYGIDVHAGEPSGPFGTEEEALADARDGTLE